MSSSSEFSDPNAIEQQTRGKKKRCPEKWKRNLRKKAKVVGKAYVSVKGKAVPARVLGGNCDCKFKCFAKITNPESIFNGFYSIDGKNQQDTYLPGLIECNPVTRRRISVREDEDSSVKARHNTFTFHVLDGAERIRVCKAAFISIHGITYCRVQRICKLLSEGKAPVDKRGKKRSVNAMPGEICLKIRNFVYSLEFKETHNASTVKKYIADPRLNIKELYDLFMKENSNIKMSYEFFRTYYKENLNFGFGKPQVDVCITCEELGIKLKNKALCDNSKRVAAAKLMIHKRRARKFYICFDYMANLPLPHIPVQEVYYMRQLWMYTFCITELNSNNAYFYVHHEGIAHKSPNEVCSWLHDYITKAKIRNPAYENLILFSDSCTGQNKNHCLLRYLMNLTDNVVFCNIDHYYLIRGHSFLPCDRNFGCIKRVLKKSDRVYSVEEYGNIITKASKQGKFHVNYVTTDMVVAFQKWWPNIYKKSCLSDESYGRHVAKEDKVTFQVSKFYQFELSSSFKGKVKAHTFIDGLTQHTFTLVPEGTITTDKGILRKNTY